MKYAIFKITDQNGAVSVNYGKMTPASRNSWENLGCKFEVVEIYDHLRIASANLKMRNDAVKSMTTLIRRAKDADLAATLEAIRDADEAPFGWSALRRRRLVLDLLGLKHGPLQDEARHMRNKATLEEVTRLFGSPGVGINDLTPEQLEEAREASRRNGFRPLF